MFEDAPIISRYTRAEAIEDGFLVDVSESDAYRDSGFKVPVAITRSVWEALCDWTEEDEAAKPGTGQSMSGRLWDVLWMSKLAARRTAGGSMAFTEVRAVPRPGRGRKRVWTIKVCIGGGDNGEPVITIMMPEED